MKDEIRIQIKERKEVTPEGIKRCQPNFRAKCIRKFPFTFTGYKSELVKVNKIDTQDKIAEYVWFKRGEGYFFLMGRCHGKTQYGNKPVCLCQIKLEDDHKGWFKYEFKHHKSRLKRYWFWGDK